MKQANQSPRTARKAEELAAELDRLGAEYVRAVDVETERVPPRLSIHLAGERIPDAVRDRLFGTWADDNDLDVTIDDATIMTGDLALVVEVRTHKPAGVVKVRRQGQNSRIVTLRREALEVSGFAEDDRVVQEARDGEIVLTQYENGGES